MLHGEALGLLLGAVGLGVVHGIEPGHGWPVAATYALDQPNRWLYGFAASLGVGHLVSSIAIVGVFFYAKSSFGLTQLNEPTTVAGVTVGGPVSIVAGVLLILLGLRECYGGGHSHDHDHSHDGHTGSHDDHNHSHVDDRAHVDEHDANDPSLRDRVRGAVPFAGGHSHDHGDLDDAAGRGLFGIAWFAFLLGFAHEEEFEIIALCAGSDHCPELMSAYALTVIAGIVGLTMLLVAGYQRYEGRVERYTPYLPAFSAAVLILMGLGFITGLF